MRLSAILNVNSTERKTHPLISQFSVPHCVYNHGFADYSNSIVLSLVFSHNLGLALSNNFLSHPLSGWEGQRHQFSNF